MSTYFSLRREPSSSADSFERFRSRVRSLISACVNVTGLLLFSSGLYKSSPATNQVTMFGIRANLCLHPAQE